MQHKHSSRLLALSFSTALFIVGIPMIASADSSCDPHAAPILDALDPTSIYNNGSYAVTVSGSNFFNNNGASSLCAEHTQVLLDDAYVNSSVKDGKTIKFPIPSTVTPGAHYVSLITSWDSVSNYGGNMRGVKSVSKLPIAVLDGAILTNRVKLNPPTVVDYNAAFPYNSTSRHANALGISACYGANDGCSIIIPSDTVALIDGVKVSSVIESIYHASVYANLADSLPYGEHTVQLTGPNLVSDIVKFTLIDYSSASSWSTPLRSTSTNPLITGIYPIKPAPGTTMAIYGANFSSSAKVVLDGKTITPISQTDSLIKFVVPTTAIVGDHLQFYVSQTDAKGATVTSEKLILVIGTDPTPNTFPAAPGTVTPGTSTSTPIIIPTPALPTSTPVIISAPPFATDTPVIIPPTTLTATGTRSTLEDLISQLKAKLAAARATTASTNTTLPQTNVAPATNQTLTTPNVAPSTTQTQATANTCVTLTRTLTLRSTDKKTAGQVTMLQKFLHAKSLLSSNPSGYFGAQTKAAVTAFQGANSITKTGTVGPATRAKIKSLTCQ